MSVISRPTASPLPKLSLPPLEFSRYDRTIGVFGSAIVSREFERRQAKLWERACCWPTDHAHLLRMPCDYVSGSLFQSVSELGRQLHGLHDSEGEGFRRERPKDPANSRAGRKIKAAIRQAGNKRSCCVR